MLTLATEVLSKPSDRINDVIIKHVISSDEAYPDSTWLMKQYAYSKQKEVQQKVSLKSRIFTNKCCNYNSKQIESMKEMNKNNLITMFPQPRMLSKSS